MLNLKSLKLSLTILIGILFLPAFTQLTPEVAVSQMIKGINLGNTLEPEYEGGWNNPNVQEYYFDLYKEAGFTHIRIPVRWDKHTATSSPFTIDPVWLNRVEEILDWGLNQGLYIIVNSHHDDWIMDDYTNQQLRNRFDSIWSQVATRFKDKPERLIFEIINEPNGPITKTQNDDLHQRILSIIRKTNPSRLVVFQGNNWGGSDGLMEAAIPDDDYLIGSFHSYDPYIFGLQGEGTWGTENQINSLRNKFISVKNWSDENGIPVLLGEFGSLRSCDYNSRMRHYKHYVQFAREYGFAYCAWDDGGNFRIMEREQKSWNELKDILIYCSKDSPVHSAQFNSEDTSIIINWTNIRSDYDNIYIHKSTSTNAYSRISTLNPGSNIYTDQDIIPGKAYYYRVIAHYDDSIDIYSQPLRITPTIYIPDTTVEIPERLFYKGNPHQIPGVIEAEDYDIGGEGYTYHDKDESNTGGAYRLDEGVDVFDFFGMGYQIVNNEAGEWYEYTVNVAQDGNYLIHCEFCSDKEGGSFQLKLGDTLSDTLYVNSQGDWLIIDTTTTSMTLSEGEQILRFTVLSTPGFTIDRFSFELNSTGISENTNPMSNVLFYQNTSGSLSWNSSLRSFNIYNIQGKLLKRIHCTDSDSSVDCSELQNGLYIIIGHSSEQKYFHQKIYLK